MRYQILQMERPEFRRFDLAAPVDLARYRETYAGEINRDEPMAALEDLFRMFNLNHPADFRSHSLSVGDIVRLDGSRLFYCDTIGWQELPA
jgi:hypothetical protein